MQVFRHIMMPSILPYLQRYQSWPIRTEPWCFSILLNLNRILSVVVVTSNFFLVMSIRRNLAVILLIGSSISRHVYFPCFVVWDLEILGLGVLVVKRSIAYHCWRSKWQVLCLFCIFYASIIFFPPLPSMILSCELY